MRGRHLVRRQWPIVFTASKGLVGVGLPRKAGKRDTPCEIVFPDGKTQSRPLGWEDAGKLPDGARIRRPVRDDTLPGGPAQRTVDYLAPFALADRETDYRVAWAVFAPASPALNAAPASCPSAGDKDAAG